MDSIIYQIPSAICFIMCQGPKTIPAGGIAHWFEPSREKCNIYEKVFDLSILSLLQIGSAFVWWKNTWNNKIVDEFLQPIFIFL